MELILKYKNTKYKNTKPYFVVCYNEKTRFSSKNECIHFICNSITESGYLDETDFEVGHDLPNKETVFFTVTPR